MNFDEIVTKTEEFLLDLPSETQANIPSFVNEAIQEAEDAHNFQHMERVLEVTSTSAQRELADFPSDWKAGRSDPWYLTDDGATREFDWAPSRSDMIRQYGDNTTVDVGSPEFILEVMDEVEGVEELWLYPFSDGQSDYTNGQYRIKIPYWGYTGDLAGAQNNFITRRGAYYCIYKATSIGFLFNRDEARAQAYDNLAARKLKRLKSIDKRGRIKRRNELTVRSGVNSPAKVPRTLGFRRGRL